MDGGRREVEKVRGGGKGGGRVVRHLEVEVFENGRICTAYVVWFVRRKRKRRRGCGW